MSELHLSNCACDDCMATDIANIILAHPQGHWTPLKLAWIRSLRQRPLNWTLEPGHCALCGGTSIADIYDHFQIKPYNVQVLDGVTYMSWLFANDAGCHAAYVACSRRGKDAVRDWAARCILSCSLPYGSDSYWRDMDYMAKKATKVAVREVDRGGERWTEIRVGING